MKLVTLPFAELKVRRDARSHIAVEFARGNKWSEFLAFEPSGLQKFREPTERFEESLYRTVDLTLERAALALIKSLLKAYLPADGVSHIIMEIFKMAATNNTNYDKLDNKPLLETYNRLAATAGKTQLKAFKEGKAKLIAKIEALSATLVAPTPQQVENKVATQAKAEVRLAGLAKAPKAEKAAPAEKAVKAPKAAKVAAPKKDGPPRVQGIGAFCVELLLKGKTNEEVVAAAIKKFEGAKTSASSVAWYRNKLKNEGKLK